MPRLAAAGCHSPHRRHAGIRQEPPWGERFHGRGVGGLGEEVHPPARPVLPRKKPRNRGAFPHCNRMRLVRLEFSASAEVGNLGHFAAHVAKFVGDTLAAG